MNPNVVHQYFKKELKEGTILLRLDPTSLSGLELLIGKNGNMQKNERHFDEEIFDDLAADKFSEGSALEFNLYLKGLKKPG